MTTRWLVLLLLTFGSACRADRDIVYAARYYAPPGSHRTSHFHIYCINPDGTGKAQLTFGNGEDRNPKWSPDGYWIAFTRQTELSEAGKNLLCLIHGNGGSMTVLLRGTSPYDDYACHWSPDSKTLAVAHTVYGRNTNYAVSMIDPQTRKVTRRFAGVSDFVWSPTGRRAYLISEADDKILNLLSGTEVVVKDRIENSVWLDEQTLIGLAHNEKTERYFLRFVAKNGRETKHLPLRIPASYTGIDSDDPAKERGSLSFTSSNGLVYGINYSNHSVGNDWYFFRLSLATNAMRFLTEGQFLAWSPDGSRFCTAAVRDTTSYEKRTEAYAVWKDATPHERMEDKYRMVYFAPLYIRATVGGPMRQLTPRLSWVTGADWRMNKR